MYRQVGNAFPPHRSPKPVGQRIAMAIEAAAAQRMHGEWRDKRSSKTSNGARTKLRPFLSEPCRRGARSRQLRTVAGGISEWARRLVSCALKRLLDPAPHNDRADLKPGQYLLETPKPQPAFAREISKETRAYVLDRNGFTCQMCGAVAGEPHPYDPHAKRVCTSGTSSTKSLGGSDEPANLRAICSVRQREACIQRHARPGPICKSCLSRFAAPRQQISWKCLNGCAKNSRHLERNRFQTSTVKHFHRAL